MSRSRHLLSLLGPPLLCLLPVACNTPAALAQKAAEGDPIAQYRYAIIVMNDAHAPADSQQQALRWLKESTASGNRNAPALLALCYTTGNLTPKDLRSACHYLSIASDRDNHRAQLLLGHFYANGLGTAPSPLKSVEQIRYAAMQGSPRAAELMFLCFYDGFGVPRNHDLALGWLQNAADYGSDNAEDLLQLVQNPKNSPNFEKNVDLMRKKLDFFPKKR